MAWNSSWITVVVTLHQALIKSCWTFRRQEAQTSRLWLLQHHHLLLQILSGLYEYKSINTQTYWKVMKCAKLIALNDGIRFLEHLAVTSTFACMCSCVVVVSQLLTLHCWGVFQQECSEPKVWGPGKRTQAIHFPHETPMTCTWTNAWI